MARIIFNLRVHRNEKRVVALVEFPIPSIADHTFHLVRECATEIEAALLADVMQDRLSSAMRQIRSKAYADGYRDGRAKRRKEDWHSSVLRLDE